MIGDDVVRKYLLELLVANLFHRAVIGVGRGVTDENVDLAERGARLVHEMLKLILGGDVGRDGDRRACAVLLVQRFGDFLTGTGLARGNDDLCALLCHLFGDRFADAAGRAGDERDLAGEIEKTGHGFLHLFHMCSIWRRTIFKSRALPIPCGNLME